MFRKVYLRLMTFLAVLCAVAFSLWVSSDTSAYTAEQVQKSIMNKRLYFHDISQNHPTTSHQLCSKQNYIC